jgi:hypothetical protein
MINPGADPGNPSSGGPIALALSVLYRQRRASLASFFLAVANRETDFFDEAITESRTQSIVSTVPG